MPRTLQPGEYVALADFRYCLRRFLRFSKEYLGREAGITPEQYEALLALAAFSSDGGMPVGDLSERLQVKHHTAVSLTDKLVAQRLVTKKRSARNRRQVNVRLTELGRRLLEPLVLIHKTELAQRSSEMIEALRRIQTR